MSNQNNWTAFIGDNLQALHAFRYLRPEPLGVAADINELRGHGERVLRACANDPSALYVAVPDAADVRLRFTVATTCAGRVVAMRFEVPQVLYEVVDALRLSALNDGQFYREFDVARAIAQLYTTGSARVGTVAFGAKHVHAEYGRVVTPSPDAYLAWVRNVLATHDYEITMDTARNSNPRAPARIAA